MIDMITKIKCIENLELDDPIKRFEAGEEYMFDGYSCIRSFHFASIVYQSDLDMEDTSYDIPLELFDRCFDIGEKNI